jgi:hypothetical protein
MRIAAVGALVTVGVLLAIAGGLTFAPHFVWKFQTLVAAILAFLGGGGAIVAAWLGAKALAGQARVNADALAQQTADTFAGHAKQEAMRVRRQEAALANALAGELTALQNQARVMREVLKGYLAAKQPVFGFTLRGMQFGDPLVLRSVAGQLGSLEPTLTEAVVELGHTVITWNIDRERLAENPTALDDDGMKTYISSLDLTDAKLGKTIPALERLGTERPS